MEQNVIINRITGYKLHGVHYICSKKKSKSILIMCHGFTGDKYELGRFPELADSCCREGYDALLFDFSGSGENERIPITLSKQIEDLESVYKWVQERKYEKVAVLGLSFGGITALGAQLLGIETYIFWAPFFFLHSTEDQTNWFKDLDKGPVRIPSSGDVEPIIIDMSFMTDFAKFRVKSFLKKLDIPTLIVQGTSDQSVPYEFSRKAFDLLPKNNKNKLVEIPEATHDFEGEHVKEFIKHTILWLRDYL